MVSGILSEQTVLIFKLYLKLKVQYYRDGEKQAGGEKEVFRIFILR